MKRRKGSKKSSGAGSRKPVATLPVEKFDPHAVELVRWLNTNGHETYIVGGSVRDLLLDRTPKDFDVVTSARPSTVKSLVPNSRVIGRRFKLVHVYTYDRDSDQVKIIETSTFRLAPVSSGSQSGVLKHDNVFSDSPEDDALRRDFTVNAFYYDVETGNVYDFAGNGMEDLEARVLRTIGDPDIRFQEDPVRIMRAVRFASKLGFRYEGKTLEYMKMHANLIPEASPRRVKDEVWRMFLSSYGAKAFTQFMDLDIMQFILPGLWDLWKYFRWNTITRALEKASELPNRVVDKVTLTPVLLYPVLVDALENHTYKASISKLPDRKKLAAILGDFGYTTKETADALQLLDFFIYMRTAARRRGHIKSEVLKSGLLPRVYLSEAIFQYATEDIWNPDLATARINQVKQKDIQSAQHEKNMVFRMVKRALRRKREMYSSYVKKEFPFILSTNIQNIDEEEESLLKSKHRPTFKPQIDIRPAPFDLELGSTDYYRDAVVYDSDFKSYKRDIDFYRIMALSLGGPVLDMGCGTGRLMARWVKEDIKVVGVDSSASMLEKARQRLNSLGSGRRPLWKLIQGDMKDIRLNEKFNLVVSAFNTMMHIYTRDDMKRFLHTVHEHLIEGGTFIFDILNPNFEWLMQSPDRRWGIKRFKHPVYHEWYYYSSNHYYDAESQIVYIHIYHEPEHPSDDLPANVFRFAQRLYFPQEMMELLEGAGFRIEGLFGHFDSRELTVDAPCQVYVVTPSS